MKRKILRADKLIAVAIFAAAVLVLYVLKTPCVFELLTGVPCPACGMTRACVAFLRFDIVGAFEYHSLFWTLPIILLLFWFDGNVFRREWLNYTLIIGIALLYIVRWIIVLSL